MKQSSSTAGIDGVISPEVARLWKKFYPDYNSRRFHALVDAMVTPSTHVLEIGAGSGRGLQNSFHLKGRVARYVGIDLDEQVLENPNLDEGIVCAAEELPFENASFDLVFHTKVAEHLQDPLVATREAARVLKPGGKLLIETPSRFYYPMLVSAVTPHWFHEFYVRKLGSGRRENETFQTFYRLNGTKAIKSVMSEAGLVEDISFWSMPPGYLRFSRMSFLLGVLYERTIEKLIPPARASIVVIATKPDIRNGMCEGRAS
jgi:ubiquinone/menaquinone biosynthesis C-methylase UbiE